MSNIIPESDSGAQFTPSHPLTAGLISHWIRRYSAFSILEGQRTIGQQSRRTPKSDNKQFPPSGILWISNFFTLLGMSLLPIYLTMPTNCVKLVILNIASHQLIIHTLFLYFPLSHKQFVLCHESCFFHYKRILSSYLI